MTGFSAAWLDLREPADHAARNPALRDRVAAAFDGRDRLFVVDLACGAGSNLRGLAEHLPALRQTWRLVDHDPALLDAARARLRLWADSVAGDDTLLLVKGARSIEVEFGLADLAGNPAAGFDARADLVTSAAFFDLVSADWIEAFASALAERRLPLHAVLTYSGEERWSPPHPRDAEMLAAFHRHQAQDKGFGPAAGPHATALLREALETRGYAATTAPSPWRLGPAQPSLVAALADGSAQAVGETELLADSAIENWRRARVVAENCEIGHVDLFARPMRG